MTQRRPKGDTEIGVKVAREICGGVDRSVIFRAVKPSRKLGAGLTDPYLFWRSDIEKFAASRKAELQAELDRIQA